MKNKIIAYTNRPATIDFIKSVADKCSVETEICKTIEATVKAVKARPNSAAIFLDTSIVEEIQQFQEFAADRVNRNRVHLMVFAQDLLLNEVIVENPIIGNVVIKRFIKSRDDGENYARIVNLTNMSSPFGLSNLIRSDGGVHILELSQAMRKDTAAIAVSRYIQQNGCSSRVASIIENAVDELLIAALVGPDDTDEALSSGLLGHLELQFGMEHDMIAITVVDHLGRIDRQQMLRNLAKCFHGRESLIQDPDLLMSGLGHVVILRSGGSLCVVCDPGKRTEVTVFFRGMERMLDLKSQFQFVSTVVQP